MKSAQLHRLEASPADQDNLSLPAWIYHDPEFFEREKQTIFRQAWQVVCHLSDIPRSGDFHTFEFLGESIVVMRTEDGGVRAFHNVCRHRAARLLDGTKGHCGKLITCPYHAWTYSLDGRLVAVPQKDSFKGLDTARHGLAMLEHEVFLGFVFVRFEPGLPSVRDMAAPYLHEMKPYRFEDLVPMGRVSLRPRRVNWKNVADNFSDGLHINVAHPGLTRLFGKGYGIEARPWIDKMWGTLRDTPSSNWSERAYQQFLPPVAQLPPGAPAPVDVLQVLAQCGARHLPGPDRLHAVRAAVRDRDHDPRDLLRASGHAARDARGALPQPAHQPPRERRGQGAHRARAVGHGLEQLLRRPAGRHRGMPAQLRAPHAQADPREPAAAGAAARLESWLKPRAAAMP